jgi:inorganic pyrophosphatase/exopolyphosphatase
MKQHEECSGLLRNIAFDTEQASALVGSTCTLVFEKYHPLQITSDATQSATIRPELSADVATLLMGVIALDTLNMSVVAGKGTPRDGRALEVLKTIAQPVIPDLDALYEELSGAKTDPSFWEELCAADCLLLDYKLFEARSRVRSSKTYNIGMSSVALSVSRFLLHKEDTLDACHSYLFSANNKGGAFCDVLIVMGSTNMPHFSRDLLVVTKSQERLDDLCAYLKATDKKVDLKLTSLFQSSEEISSVQALRDQFAKKVCILRLILRAMQRRVENKWRPLRVNTSKPQNMIICKFNNFFSRFSGIFNRTTVVRYKYICVTLYL